MGLLAPRVMNSDVAKPVAQVFSTTNMPGARSKNSHSHFSVSDLSKYDLVKVECQSLELSQISRPLTGRDERSVRGKVTRKEQTHKRARLHSIGRPALENRLHWANQGAEDFPRTWRSSDDPTIPAVPGRSLC